MIREFTIKLAIIALIFAIAIFLLYFFHSTPAGRTVMLLIKTDQQKQIVKDILNKEIGFELPDECDISMVVIHKGKDREIFIKGMVSDAELIPLHDNSDYRRLFCQNNELVFSLFNDLSNEQHIAIDRACKYKKESENFVEIILVPDNSTNGCIIYFNIFDNKFSLQQLMKLQ